VHAHNRDWVRISLIVIAWIAHRDRADRIIVIAWIAIVIASIAIVITLVAGHHPAGVA
jgi:hypothetical protein